MRAAHTPHRSLHRTGIAVLVVGWAAAMLILLFAGADDPQAAERTHVAEQQIERFGGKMTLQMVELQDWLGSLWHGRRLAYTLALLSTAVGGVCLHVARLAAEDVDDRA